MNKYSLNFHNPQIENQYQAYQQHASRARSFNIVTAGFVFSLVLRIMTGLILQDYTFFEYNIGLLIYVLLQFVIIRWKPRYTRLGFVLINFSNLAYNMENNSQTSLEIAYLKGSNAMAVNLLIILAGEFPESVLVFSIQTIYRLVSAFIFGLVINWTVFFSSVLINMACFIYFYHFFKAKRSQYLLTLVDDCWDNILSELITDPYILLKFDFENLKFTIEKVKDFAFSRIIYSALDSQNRQVKEFLRNAKVSKRTVEEYIYSLIKNFVSNQRNSFRQNVFTRYNKKIFQLEISIFQANHPTIILKIKKPPLKSLQAMKKYKQRFISYNFFIIRFLKGLEQKYHVNNVKRIRRKLIQIQFLNQIQSETFITKMFNIEKIITNLQHLYPEKILTIKNDLIYPIIFTTIPNIFILLLMKLLDNALSTEILIVTLKIEEGVQLIFQGTFDTPKIINFIKKLNNPIHQILEKQIIQRESNLIIYLEILFQLYLEPYLSYDQNFVQHQSLNQLN